MTSKNTSNHNPRPSSTMPKLSEGQLELLFQRLNLAHTRRIYQDLADRAEKENWSYRDFLALLLAEEAPRLRTLKVQPEQLALRIPVYVGPTGTVLHDGHAYSMPPEAISMPATLYLYGQRVRIVAGRYEAEHPRKFSAQESSSLPEHRAAMVAAVSGKRGKRYLKRQQLLELGEPAIRYLTEIVHRRPRQWFEDVDRLHQLLQNHGPEVLRRAMEEGLKQQTFGASYVERSLQPGLSFPQVVQ